MFQGVLPVKKQAVKDIDGLRDQLTKVHKEVRELKSERDEDLAEINQEAERRLIEIGTGLDALGREAIGGLHYRINRSRYYANIYRQMVRTLRVGNIETWWSYEQFATRGVDPAFQFIEGVGERLDRLRSRLRGAMESVQTSAIVNQTEATRDNTFQLEMIANELSTLTTTAANILEETEKWRKWAAIVGAFAAIIGVIIGKNMFGP